jgi:hypothetical protein
MPRKTGCGWIFTEEEEEIVNKLSSGPKPRDEFFGKGNEVNYEESFRLSGIIDPLVAKDIIRKAQGVDDVVYYLTSQECKLIRNGVLSKERKPVPDLFEFLDSGEKDRFLRTNVRERHG